MKTNINFFKSLGPLKNWTNGVIAAGTAGAVSFGSVGTGVCTGSCGSGCGFGCAGMAVSGLIIAALNCKKKSKSKC